MALNTKQQRFIDEYVKDSNGTQAAIRAGYSAKTAYAQAHELLKKPDIQQGIADAHAQIAEANAVQHSEVIDGLRAIIADQDAPPAAKVAALDKLARIAGMYDDKTKVDGNITISWED